MLHVVLCQKRVEARLIELDHFALAVQHCFLNSHNIRQLLNLILQSTPYTYGSSCQLRRRAAHSEQHGVSRTSGCHHRQWIHLGFDEQGNSHACEPDATQHLQTFSFNSNQTLWDCL